MPNVLPVPDGDEDGEPQPPQRAAALTPVSGIQHDNGRVLDFGSQGVGKIDHRRSAEEFDDSLALMVAERPEARPEGGYWSALPLSVHLQGASRSDQPPRASEA